MTLRIKRNHDLTPLPREGEGDLRLSQILPGEVFHPSYAPTSLYLRTESGAVGLGDSYFGEGTFTEYSAKEYFPSKTFRIVHATLVTGDGE